MLGTDAAASLGHRICNSLHRIFRKTMSLTGVGFADNLSYLLECASSVGGEEYW